MKKMKKMYGVLALIVLLALATSPAMAQDTSMSFFVTSVAPGDGGGDLGGLHGADMHCQALAGAAGEGNKNWHAYLSQSNPALNINARDRIGLGPWYNARGTLNTCTPTASTSRSRPSLPRKATRFHPRVTTS